MKDILEPESCFKHQHYISIYSVYYGFNNHSQAVSNAKISLENLNFHICKPCVYKRESGAGQHI